MVSNVRRVLCLTKGRTALVVASCRVVQSQKIWHVVVKLEGNKQSEKRVHFIARNIHGSRSYFMRSSKKKEQKD